jgi:hypothetical protein
VVGVKISRSKYIRWLGICIDEGLRFTSHCKELLKESRSKMLYLARTCSGLTKACRKKLAEALIYSPWTFASFVWSDVTKEIRENFYG